MVKTRLELEKELKIWTDAFPGQSAINVKKLLEDAKKKPDMVDKETQTELSWIEVTNMETNHAKIVDFIKKTNFIKDEDKNKDVTFKLEMIERGIAGFKEDLDHSQKKLKVRVEELEINLTNKDNENVDLKSELFKLKSEILQLEEKIEGKESKIEILTKK